MIPLTPGSHIYCIGICGTGMSNLARYLRGQGVVISGSDGHLGYYTISGLQDSGITCHEGFKAARIDQLKPDGVIYSAAYSAQTNEELARVDALGIPAMSYPEVLADISRTLPAVCVAGSHGKTTTAYMTLLGLESLGVSAAPLIGAPYPISLHPPEAAVIEACEYRGHFLSYAPEVSVITSIDHDHVDSYSDPSSYREAFSKFAGLTRGEMILHEQAGLDAESCGCRAVHYGASQIERTEDGWLFQPWGLEARLEVPGRHIAEDALAALLAVRGWWMQVHRQKLEEKQLQLVLDGICSYRGTYRRYERIGEYGNILFIDDYAHHPTEITALLTGLREAYPGRRIVADFTPHTVSRTRAFLPQFIQALSGVDVLVVQEIYPSQRETETADQLSSQAITEAITGARYCRDEQEAYAVLDGLLQEGDLCITMGAGNNRSVGIALAEARKGA